MTNLEEIYLSTAPAFGPRFAGELLQLVFFAKPEVQGGAKFRHNITVLWEEGMAKNPEMGGLKRVKLKFVDELRESPVLSLKERIYRAQQQIMYPTFPEKWVCSF
jgi:hypothetical protein